PARFSEQALLPLIHRDTPHSARPRPASGADGAPQGSGPYTKFEYGPRSHRRMRRRRRLVPRGTDSLVTEAHPAWLDPHVHARACDAIRRHVRQGRGRLLVWGPPGVGRTTV